MFGHLDLALDDDPLFRACRCGLCHRLTCDYGAKARHLTNDDIALLLWLITHFSPTLLASAKKVCPLHARRDSLHDNPLVRFSAAATILLVWEKLVDDIYDEGKTLSTKVK